MTVFHYYLINRLTIYLKIYNYTFVLTLCLIIIVSHEFTKITISLCYDLETSYFHVSLKFTNYPLNIIVYITNIFPSN